MALPTVSDLKDYLRIETADEDDRLTALLDQAEAAIETWLQRPITAGSAAYTDEGLGYPGGCGVLALIYPVFPIGTTGTPAVPAVAITDADGVTVATTDYRVDRRTGIIRAEPGVTFANPPYTITATAGLSAAADYATRIEPAVSRAILALASHYYHRTNPAAVQESSGGGASTTYADGLLPKDVAALVQPFRLERVA